MKMLPFDNKSEFQVIDRHARGTALEDDGARRTALARHPGDETVVNVQPYAGMSAPYNFNGLVRHYFLRRGPTSPTCR